MRLGGSGSGPKIVEEAKRITLGLDEESTDIRVILGPGTLNRDWCRGSYSPLAWWPGESCLV